MAIAIQELGPTLLPEIESVAEDLLLQPLETNTETPVTTADISEPIEYPRVMHLPDIKCCRSTDLSPHEFEKAILNRPHTICMTQQKCFAHPLPGVSNEGPRELPYYSAWVYSSFVGTMFMV